MGPRAQQAVTSATRDPFEASEIPLEIAHNSEMKPPAIPG